ncbi:DUF4450 domain-containing protein [Echinicola jeungdonensis]|uniref:DUF4450 domain-containing protein n=1 Tax=Echinicola jeungdonensis TaxID=709343 RepID=A0ABV5J8D1_9BACT|nr:DUF4450 domain-containing protein [Echinicola jeungdonensis]MDN3669472.1 DUF4450 domain-containing protein [Echinicola jeungdonensis]
MFSITKNQIRLSVLALGLLFTVQGPAQAQEYWHDQPREVRYTPDGKDFVIVNGDRKFNRALYGYHSDFRTEAGDLPEFSFYLPGMGGNFRFGIQKENNAKWLEDAVHIESRYQSGKMHYVIADPILGSGKIEITVMPLREREGAIFKVEEQGVPESVNLLWLYGGVTGKRFSRMGDLGADPPSVFYLTEEKSMGNDIQIAGDNRFELLYGEENEEGRSKMLGVFPENASLKLANPEHLYSISNLLKEGKGEAEVILGQMPFGFDTEYFSIYRPGFGTMGYADLEPIFEQADTQRKVLANRIKVNTPDPYINTVGGALGIAADAIYDEPAYVHGAVAWRMPLPGWRGAYVADWMGWHERAKTHFNGYLESQYLEPGGTRNDPDTAKHLARQMEVKGKSIFNRGYISRRPGEPSAPHHYDMNQVFFDQLIRHFDWTGDKVYLLEVWPSILRHLNWEKRNFDPDGDGLYNAYASIWASDALQYNSGGVAHASAYNYYANKKAAELARILGEEDDQFEAEAKKILDAMNGHLWLEDQGWYAEYKDFLGPERLHPNAGVWSVYHTVDSEVPDPFQAYQMTRYLDEEIPHIPLVAQGLPEGEYHTISTTNWMPYTWSVNNVALAEVLHTSLAYWQAGNSTEAFRLWKSAILESMYLGGSPGNFQQLSFLDAMRSELYRDFADAVGMGARSLIEGLFGVKPDLLHDKINIVPGFPAFWEYATLSTPDLAVDFRRSGMTDQYEVVNRFGKTLELNLVVNARNEKVQQVLVNGQNADWELLEYEVGQPRVLIKAPMDKIATVSITWEGEKVENMALEKSLTPGVKIMLEHPAKMLLDVYDPEKILAEKAVNDGKFHAVTGEKTGNGTFFVKIKQGEMNWWEPMAIEIRPTFEIKSAEKQNKNSLQFTLSNNEVKPKSIEVKVNGKVWKESVQLADQEPLELTVQSPDFLKTGTNIVEVYVGEELLAQQKVINWNFVSPKQGDLETVDISPALNDKVTQIFRNNYYSPRSPYPTLQIPVHGMGDWASHGAYMDINDAGLRELAGEDHQIELPQGIAFQTPGDDSNNILFASLWDNYPDQGEVKLEGKAKHAYFLMAGSTNHMQSRMDNGKLIVHYKDGSTEEMELKNPENWWPIEQDYFIDGYAFDIDQPRPIRVHLKSGKISNEAHDDYVGIDHFTNYGIDGGAATVLDLPLDESKELESLEIKATTIEVVIGLMAVTLER